MQIRLGNYAEEVEVFEGNIKKLEEF